MSGLCIKYPKKSLYISGKLIYNRKKQSAFCVRVVMFWTLAEYLFKNTEKGLF